MRGLLILTLFYLHHVAQRPCHNCLTFFDIVTDSDLHFHQPTFFSFPAYSGYALQLCPGTVHASVRKKYMLIPLTFVNGNLCWNAKPIFPFQRWNHSNQYMRGFSPCQAALWLGHSSLYWLLVTELVKTFLLSSWALLPIFHIMAVNVYWMKWTREDRFVSALILGVCPRITVLWYRSLCFSRSWMGIVSSCRMLLADEGLAKIGLWCTRQQDSAKTVGQRLKHGIHQDCPAVVITKKYIISSTHLKI